MSDTTMTTTPAERIRSAAEDAILLANQATPGPWSHEETDVLWKLMGNLGDGTFHGLQIAKCPKQGTPYAEYWPAIDDAEFIAASRTLVPQMAQAVIALVDELARQRKSAETAYRWTHFDWIDETLATLATMIEGADDE